jgi:diguanylate cyclase (GGDEF)-like protein/PAS domain S-box-containing protein
MTMKPSKPKKKTIKTKKTTSLRKRTAGILAKQKERIRELSDTNLKKLVCELGTHKIELEIQNEELRRAQMEIESSHRKYSDLYDFSPVGYFTFDKNGLIREVNLTGAGMLGIEKRFLIGTPIQNFIELADREVFRDHLVGVLKSRTRKTCEINMRRMNGTLFPAQLQSISSDSGERGIDSCRTAVSDISESRRADHAQHLASFPQLNPNPIIEVDASGVIVFINPAAHKVLESLGMGKDDATVFLPHDIASILRDMDKKSDIAHYRELAIRDRVFSETVHLVPQFNVARIYTFDITERKRMEVTLQVSERRLKLAAASGRLGIWDRDIESGNQIWDDRMYEIYGVAKDSCPATFETWTKYLHPDDREKVIKESQAAVRGEKDYDTEFRILHPDGSLRYIKANGLVIRDTKGKPIRAIGINWDITEQKNLEENLRNLSLTDDLTGLYNRRGFFTMAEPVLKLAKRYQRSVFLLYADIDELKEINDVLGHKEGDQAIKDIANIFKATFRETDVVARIGGDEFVVIPVAGNREDADIVAARFKERVMVHNKKNHRAYTLSTSAGMSCYDPSNPRSIDDLLNQAEKLMYEEKMLKQKTD